MAKAFAKDLCPRISYNAHGAASRADLLDNGSIYWVIKRQIGAQQITDIEEFTDDQASAGVTCILIRRWC